MNKSTAISVGATVSTAGVLALVGASWPAWTAWGGIVAYQVVTHLRARRAA
ncbi:MAG: hypothetical protein QM809_18015 [Gordonia sp. (in: high G+C Gram-positive bacteria)]|uniref:hypothetical protein n=1 Tax=Gordonia sp. (in: high G+C Gram-positive bacteria) TaxID=84139 RepID=UPI0039E5EFFC